MSDLQLAGDEVTITEKLVDAAQRLERAGAEGLLIACNTKHYAATDVTAAISIPFLHIADGVGRAINAAGHRRVGLLGTRFVMEQAFYRDYLEAEFDLDIIVPGDADRISLHDLILDKLVRGIVSENGQALLREVASRLGEEGATCAILGCTELEMAAVAGQEPIPYFDTTALHVDAAIDFIVG